MFLNSFSAAGGLYRRSATLKKGLSKTASNQLHLCAFSVYSLIFNWLRKPEHTDHNPAFHSELSVSNCTHTLSLTTFVIDLCSSDSFTGSSPFGILT